MSALFAYFEFSAFKLAILPVVAFALVYAASRHDRPETKKLIIIDAYADNTLLDIIKRLDIEVIIITKKDNLLTKQDIEKYNKQYNNLKVIFNNSFHDRYFLIDDETIYHCGSSINRIGYKTFSINLVSDKEVCEMLINKVNEIV